MPASPETLAMRRPLVRPYSAYRCTQFAIALLVNLFLFVDTNVIAQDRLKPLEVGEDVEVFFLDDWRPGKIVATDKRQNARVEFEFAAGRQTKDFIRNAVRRPYEKGAIIATRTFSDATGKFKIVAATIAVTTDQIRLRKSDLAEIDVPLSKLSDSDQRYIKSLINKGLTVSDKLPGPQLPGSRTWTLRGGRAVDGVFVAIDQRNNVVIRLADGTTSELAMSQLSPKDMSFAMEKQAEAQRAMADAEFDRASAAMRDSQDKFEKDFNNLPGMEDVANLGSGNASSIGGKPKAELRAQLLTEDRWDFAPDRFERSSILPVIETDRIVGNASKIVSHDGSKLLLVSQAAQSALVDLKTGEVADVGDVAGAIEARGNTGIKSLSPSGNLIAYQSRGYQDSLCLYDLSANQVLSTNWSPYGPGRDIYHIQFLDDQHLLTVSLRGDLGVWDIATKQIVWWMVSRPACIPALSAGAKYLFVHTNEHLVVVEALTGKVVSQARSNPVAVRALAVDDTCQRLVSLGNGTAKFWDLTSGKMVGEFGVATAIVEPSLAFWISPTQVMVGALRGENTLFDIIDVSLQGTAYCINVNGNLLAAPNDRYICTASLPRRFVIMHPPLPSSEMRQATQRFESDLIVNLRQGSRVQIDLDLPPTVDRQTETKRIADLLTQAGYQVVNSGGEATFTAIIREAKDYKGIELEDLPDEAFQANQKLMLEHNGEVIWRATKDIYGVDKENRWAGYVIPRKLRIPKQRETNFVLRKPDQWVSGEMERNYDEGIRQRYGFKTSYQPSE